MGVREAAVEHADPLHRSEKLLHHRGCGLGGYVAGCFGPQKPGRDLGQAHNSEVVLEQAIVRDADASREIRDEA